MHVVSYTEPQLPDLLTLYAKTLLKRELTYTRLPELCVEVFDITLCRSHLEKYLHFFEFSPQYRQTERAPLPFLYVFTQKPQLTLLTRPEFPLKLLGLVHLGVKFIQRFPVCAQDRLTVRAYLSGQEECAHGQSFTVTTEIWTRGQVAVEMVNHYLSKRPGNHRPARNGPRTPFSDAAPQTTFYFGSADIRRYARLSGDFNPIHLYQWTARLCGMKKPIVHGMYSVGKIMGYLSNQNEREIRQASFKFTRPVYVPNDLSLWTHAFDNRTMVTLGSRSNAPSVSAEIEYKLG
ncbi:MULTISPECIES: MaoC/PaaZ C-terminal domain-containing protein [unclassified Hahella]|uniref:MaoC family dehydratase n=1 Tax=unclassified Hahella TaxID=2624107 RepID=UPI001C1F15A0|nr:MULTISPECIES: MaoC/PaaZ C-terminal domain-containing protein [unclassified Hahella]MBU6951694.1 hypothetical protein [Hahella sp. HN01]MDG9666596.1 MaoC/PaaZ C-terminal domain-containing protein [Hahella sp. CR1]